MIADHATELIVWRRWPAAGRPELPKGQYLIRLDPPAGRPRYVVLSYIDGNWCSSPLDHATWYAPAPTGPLKLKVIHR